MGSPSSEKRQDFTKLLTSARLWDLLASFWIRCLRMLVSLVAKLFSPMRASVVQKTTQHLLQPQLQLVDPALSRSLLMQMWGRY
jgi:hypothetical protein